MSELTSLKSRFSPRALAAPLLAAVLAFTLALPTLAQNLFAPVARVNQSVVTEFEVQQRQRFLQLLNAPGADRESVVNELIEDRLRSDYMNRFDIELSQEELAEGLADFASRANLTTEEFVAALNQAGVDYETFRDFVRIQMLWRSLIRARFGPRVSITDGDVDRELASTPSTTGVRVLLSEIIIPAPPQNAARVAALADQISQTRSISEFSSYARRYSATATRGQGGRLPWTPLENLPPAIAPLILELAEGEVTAPLNIPNAVALFQLRGIEETGERATSYSEIEYAAYYIAGGRSEAALNRAEQLRTEVDDCNDLYGVAKGQPASVLDRGSKAPGEIPQDIALELAKLDHGEVSTALTRANGQTLVFLMLCKRVAEEKAEVTREQAVGDIRQRKLQGYARQFIEELRANARITRL